MNWRKWHEGKQKRSERAQKAALTRWERVHQTAAGEPVRRDWEPRIVQVVVRPLGEPQICLVLVQSEKRRNRWRVTEQGQAWDHEIGAWEFGRAVGRMLGMRIAECGLRKEGGR